MIQTASHKHRLISDQLYIKFEINPVLILKEVYTPSHTVKKSLGSVCESTVERFIHVKYNEFLHLFYFTNFFFYSF